MILEPTFLNHYKIRQLISITGRKDAPLAVISLWMHCQEKKAWAFKNMHPRKLAGVCSWDEDPEAWHSTLLDLEIIEIDDSGDLWVHDWAVVNRSLIQRWELGAKRGGFTHTPYGFDKSDRQATAKRPTSDRLATAKPRNEATDKPPLAVDKPPPKRLKKVIKEENKKKEKKKSATAPALSNFLKIWEADESEDLRSLPDGEKLKKACQEFIEHRETMRPPAKMTPKTVEMLFRDLRKVEPPVAIALLEDAVRNGTRGWFWEDKAQRFRRDLNRRNDDDEPMNPDLADDGPDPWR